MEKEESSAIDSLNQKLYSRNKEESQGSSAPHLHQINNDIVTKEKWESVENEPSSVEQNPNMKRKRKFLKLFAIGSVIFFFLALALGALIIWGGGNQVSPERIIIEIEDGLSASGGKVFDFNLVIDNKNNVELQNTKLTLTFPDGTRNAENQSQELKRDVRSLSLIKSNSIVTQNYKAILYGDKDDIKNINVDLEYSVPGSDSYFIKNTVLEVLIDTSPITIDITMGDEYISGETVTTDVFVSSNTDETLDNIILVAEYPFGLAFKESTPKASFEDRVWDIGTLSPTEKKKISIKSTVTGTANDERTIRFKVGVKKTGDNSAIGSLISQANHTYSLQSPLLDLALELNGKESGDSIINMGSVTIATVRVKNNTKETIQNVSVDVAVPGEIIDENNIKVSDGGFYRSSDKMIVWDNNSNSKLRSLAPGTSLGLSFEIPTISAFASGVTSLRNPSYTIVAKVAGLSESGNTVSGGKIENSTTRTVKINTKLSLTSDIYYSNGPISNSGPLPPKVNNRTTYTVTWSLTNTYNPLTNVTVSASLPTYVDWSSVFSPSSEDVTYNSITRTINWDVGRVEAGTGQNKSPKTVSFQVSLVPSTSQIGTNPILVENPIAKGRDDFTDQSIQSGKSSLTTNIQNDPLFVKDIGVVVP